MLALSRLVDPLVAQVQQDSPAAVTESRRTSKAAHYARGLRVKEDGGVWVSRTRRVLLLLIDEHAYDVALIRVVLEDRSHRARLNMVLASEAQDFIKRGVRTLMRHLQILVLLDVALGKAHASFLSRSHECRLGGTKI